MASEIQQQYITGKTVYATVTRADGQIWRTDASAFEARASADWVHYAIATAEIGGTGYYIGNFPAAITSAGNYSVQFWAQAGSSPSASADANNGMLGGAINWTGTAEAFALASSAANAVNAAMNGQNLAANVLQWNGSAVSLTSGLPNVSSSGGVSSGPIPINQNTGGTDNLRYVDESGNGVGDANILIYLASDWPGNPSAVQATAMTGPDGRWLAPAFVQSGTYVAVFTKVGADGPDTSPPVTV